NPLSTVPQLYQTRFCSRPPPFVVKRSFPSEAPNMLKLTYVTTPNRVPHSLRFLQRVRVFLAVLFCLSCAFPLRAADTATPTIAKKPAGTQKLPGYFNLYWDAKQGKLWLEIDKWSTQFIYQSGLSAGIGSNDIGLDRGQLGTTRIVRFERIGPKI